MKSIEEQLARYKSVHLNKKNIQTHFVGVPLIVFAVTLMLSMVTFEVNMEVIFGRPFYFSFSLAMAIFSVVALYYLVLHRLLALGMFLYIVANLMLAELFRDTQGLIIIALALFVLGWLIQFIGHYFEKAKPAFVDDLSQFLIGPLFLMAELYFMLGLEPRLNARITPIALEKRKALEQS
ncbi:DUF962 domain-containing protein [Colwelliaceae bacterium MEBiC 14330]